MNIPVDPALSTPVTRLLMQIPGIHLRIQQLESETAQPERREAARARKKLTKDVQRHLSDSGKTDADKVKYLEGIFSDQVIRLLVYACSRCLTQQC